MLDTNKKYAAFWICRIISCNHMTVLCDIYCHAHQKMLENFNRHKNIFLRETLISKFPALYKLTLKNIIGD